MAEAEVAVVWKVLPDVARQVPPKAVWGECGLQGHVGPQAYKEIINIEIFVESDHNLPSSLLFVCISIKENFLVIGEYQTE